MDDLTRRQLEVERRIWLLGDMIAKETARSELLAAGAEKLAAMYTLVWNYPGWFTGYPWGSCYGGISSTPKPWSWTPTGLGTVSGPSFPPSMGCGWSNPIGVATPENPAIVYKYVVKMVYQGQETIVASYEYTCKGWVINATPMPIPNVSVWDPVSFKWEYFIAKPMYAVLVENIGSNFLWFDSNFYKTNPYYLGGSVSMTPDPSTPLTGEDGPYYYGSSDSGTCYVGNSQLFAPGYKRKVTLTSSAAPVNTLATVASRYKVTLLGAEITAMKPTSAIPAEQAEYYRQKAHSFIDPFIGLTLSFGKDGNQCENFRSSGNGTTVDKEIERGGDVNILCTAGGGAVDGLGGGRWATSETKVGWDSCETPPSIYSKLPSTVSIGRYRYADGMNPSDAVKACGFSISGMGGPLDTSQGMHGIRCSYGGRYATLPIPYGPIKGGSYTFTDYDDKYNFENAASLMPIGVPSSYWGYAIVKGTWKIEFP